MAEDRDKARVKVLLVDNNRHFVNLLSLFLNKEGYDVQKAFDGVEALEIVRDSTPDVIILDLVMPKIDGARVCHYLKLDPRYKNIPILILTGVAAEFSSQIFEVGADAYVAKGNFEQIKKDILSTLSLYRKKSWLGAARASIIGIERMQPREVVSELLIAQSHRETLLGNIGEGVLEIDAEGRIIYANPAASRILGIQESDLIVKSFSSTFEEQFSQEMARVIEKFKEATTPHQETLTLPYHGRTLRINFANILEEQKYAGLSAIIEDISSLTGKIQELSLLSEIGIVLTSTLNLRTVLDLVVAKVQEILDVEAGSLLMLQKGSTDLVFEVALGEKWEALRGKRVKGNQGIWMQVIESKEPLLLTEIDEGEDFHRSLDQQTGFTTRSILCVPIVTRGEAIGALQVLNKRGKIPFTEEDKGLLSSIARYAAIAIENARLYDEQRAMNEDLKAMQKRLLEDQRLKAMADLAGAMAHALREPVKSVQKQSEVLLRSLPDEHPAHQHMKDLMAEIDKLAATVLHIEKITKMGKIVEKEGQREKKKS